MKKAYIIPRYSELERIAKKYLKIYQKGRPTMGFNLEDRIAVYEAALDLADQEFWKSIREYVRFDFKEELKGDWVLTQMGNHYIIEKDSGYID